MNPAWTVAFAALVPFLCLGLVLWMARLEDTLTEGIVSPASAPEPSGSLSQSPAVESAALEVAVTTPAKVSSPKVSAAPAAVTAA